MMMGGLGKKRGLVVMLVLLTVCGGLLVLHEVQGQVGDVTLSVVTYNIGTLNGDKPRLAWVVKALRKKGVPDLVLLQEVPSEAFAADMALKLGLPHHVYAGYNANGKGYGLAIVSKSPLSNPKMHDLKPYGHSALIAELDSPDGSQCVSSVHLERVRQLKSDQDGFQITWREALGLLKTELTQDTPRSGAVKAVLDLLRQRGCDQVIVGGDFNTVPFSTAIRKMGKCYEDALWLRTDYLTASYKKVSFPIKPRIDYIFYSGEMRCRSASVIKQGGGDHYPVRAVLVLGS